MWTSVSSMSRRVSSPRSSGPTSKYPATSCGSIVASPSLSRAEEEELGLRAALHVEALGLRVGEDLLELDARVAGERRAVGIGDVADDARDLARLAPAPRQHRERVGVGMEVHVGLLDALEAADRRAVEHQLVVERLVELLDRDRDVPKMSVQLGEDAGGRT